MRPLPTGAGGQTRRHAHGCQQKSAGLRTRILQSLHPVADAASLCPQGAHELIALAGRHGQSHEAAGLLFRQA